MTTLTNSSSSTNLATIILSCLCLLFAVAIPAQQQGGAAAEANTSAFTTFEVAGAGKGIYEGTYALSINTAGTVTGYYIDSKFAYHGFLRTSGGTITTFDAPGAGKEAYDGTYPFSINTAGEIAGWYTDSSGLNHGFVRVADGKITTFEAPGASPATQGTGDYSMDSSPSTPRGLSLDTTLTPNTYFTVSFAQTPARRRHSRHRVREQSMERELMAWRSTPREM